MPRGALAIAALLLGGCLAPAASPAGSLLAEREAAVRRGYEWLARFLADPAKSAPLGIDAVLIFLEPAAAATEAGLREFADAEARRQARRLADRLFAAPLPLPNFDVLNLVALGNEAEAVGLDPAPLRARAEEAFRALPTPDAVYGYAPLTPGGLAKATDADLLDLLLTTWVLAKAQALGIRYGTSLDQATLLGFLAGRPLASSPAGLDPEPFRDAVYLTTHVAFVASDYGRLRFFEEDAPWACDHLRRAFPAVLRLDDLELAAEVADAHRSLGLTEDDDPLLLRTTRWLLEAQNPDGSWGPAGVADPYRAIHPTWCAIGGLRPRAFLPETPYVRAVREALRAAAPPAR